MLPQDVTQIGQQHVQQLAALGGSCLLWAGWECQDLSAAGKGEGLLGQRSRTFFFLHQVLRGLRQQLGPRLAWFLENTAMDVKWQRSETVREDYQLLQSILGQPLQLDAAQFGSRAHRLRCYWTNLAPQPAMQRVLATAVRPAGLLVQDILGPGRRCQQVCRDDEEPFYKCNKVGQPMQALPTLVATVGSYAFRNEGAGTVWDEEQQGWTEPTVEERERALGYSEGATAAPGVSRLVRHAVTGRCMDANVLMAMVAVAQAIVLQGGQLLLCRVDASPQPAHRQLEQLDGSPWTAGSQLRTVMTQRTGATGSF